MHGDALTDLLNRFGLPRVAVDTGWSGDGKVAGVLDLRGVQHARSDGSARILVSGMGPTVWRLALSPAGALSVVDSVDVGQATPWIALAPDGLSAFLVQRRAADRGGEVRGFYVPAAGPMALSRDAAVGCGGVDPVHGTVFRRLGGVPAWLFTANGDGIGVVGVDVRGGAVAPLVAVAQPGSTKNSQVVALPAVDGGAVLLVTNFGGDAVVRLELDIATGAATVTHTSPLPPGSGPRRLLVHGRVAYVVGETAATVTTFAFDAARARLGDALRTVSTLPPGASREGVTSAQLTLAPGGRMLFVSNRSDRGDDSVAAFAIDPRTGNLGDGPVGWATPASAATDLAGAVVGGGAGAPAPGDALRVPRDMCVVVMRGGAAAGEADDGSGWFVLVANQAANTVTAYRRRRGGAGAAADAPLEATSCVHLPGAAPTCLVPLPY